MGWSVFGCPIAFVAAHSCAKCERMNGAPGKRLGEVSGKDSAISCGLKRWKFEVSGMVFTASRGLDDACGMEGAM